MCHDTRAVARRCNSAQVAANWPPAQQQFSRRFRDTLLTCLCGGGERCRVTWPDEEGSRPPLGQDGDAAAGAEK